MSATLVTAVGIRLFAVWLGFELIGEVIGYLSFPSARGAKFLVAALFITVGTIVVLGLWIFPLTFARKLVPTGTPEAAQVSDVDAWLAVGCALLGLWVLATALPKIIGDLLIIRLYSSETDTTPILRGLIYPFLQVLVATWLIFGAKGFRRVFWWARNAGSNGAL